MKEVNRKFGLEIRANTLDNLRDGEAVGLVRKGKEIRRLRGVVSVGVGTGRCDLILAVLPALEEDDFSQAPPAQREC